MAELDEVYSKAISFLARREHSIEELIAKLKARYSEHIEEVIDELIKKKYLDDERFARVFIEYRINKGFGPIWIKQALKTKGLSSHIIEKVLYDDKIDWISVARKVKIKKYGDTIPSDLREKNKQYSFLQTRGFTFDQINMVYKYND